MKNKLKIFIKTVSSSHLKKFQFIRLRGSPRRMKMRFTKSNSIAYVFYFSSAYWTTLFTCSSNKSIRWKNWQQIKLNCLTLWKKWNYYLNTTYTKIFVRLCKSVKMLESDEFIWVISRKEMKCLCQKRFRLIKLIRAQIQRKSIFVANFGWNMP